MEELDLFLLEAATWLRQYGRDLLPFDLSFSLRLM
jgi:hypothetical protein